MNMLDVTGFGAKYSLVEVDDEIKTLELRFNAELGRLQREYDNKLAEIRSRCQHEYEKPEWPFDGLLSCKHCGAFPRRNND